MNARIVSRMRKWEGVVQAAGREKAAFEIVAAAAMGAGLMRWRLAVKALDEASDATAGN